MAWPNASLLLSYFADQERVWDEGSLYCFRSFEDTGPILIMAPSSSRSSASSPFSWWWRKRVKTKHGRKFGGQAWKWHPWLPLTFHWPELSLMAMLKSKESWKVGPSGAPKTKRRAWIPVLGTAGKPLFLGLILHSIHLETTCSAPTWYLALFDWRYSFSPSQWLDTLMQTKSGLFKVE